MQYPVGDGEMLEMVCEQTINMQIHKTDSVDESNMALISESVFKIRLLHIIKLQIYINPLTLRLCQSDHKNG